MNGPTQEQRAANRAAAQKILDAKKPVLDTEPPAPPPRPQPQPQPPDQPPSPWRHCDWAEAEQFRCRTLSGSIGLEGPWTEWADGKPPVTPMNLEFQYRAQRVVVNQTPPGMPHYARLGQGGPALVHTGTNGYYRHAGEWTIHASIGVDGRTYSDEKDEPRRFHANGHEMVECTEAEWREDQGQWAP
jgi:hypothetical protein